jgi:hypothetical protein
MTPRIEKIPASIMPPTPMLIADSSPISDLAVESPGWPMCWAVFIDDRSEAWRLDQPRARSRHEALERPGFPGRVITAPGQRPVDLQRVPVLRAGHRRATAARLSLRLLDLPSRVQPQTRVRLRRPDGPAVQHDGRPHVLPARCAQGAHAVRQQRPPAPQTRPRATGTTGSRDRETSVEPAIFRWGLLTLKRYTKGERVLRFEAIAHQTKQLGCGRRLDKFHRIISRLTAMVDRITRMLDCVEFGFLPDVILDRLPAPSKLGATRPGGLDLNRPRVSAALAAALALAVAQAGFSDAPSSDSRWHSGQYRA